MAKTAPVLNVTARAPFTVHFEGEAEAVTATNSVGTFDILPGHADFFSMLEPCDVTVTTHEESISFPISNGMIIVQNNEVMLFVNV